jgi:FtsP/CotA-like multicopper oxidase with cupredoxin domain
MWIGTPAVLTTGQQSYILVGPGQTSFAEINGTASGMIALAMPEMIWQPGTSFRLTITNRQAGDSVGTGYAAVEIYTEDYNADGQLVPLATPLLT